MKKCLATLAFITGLNTSACATQSIARFWDEQILAAIRLDSPHPPVHARNLFSPLGSDVRCLAGL